MNVVPAAGTLPWRHGPHGLEVALIHRPRYDDWSWAKGKLDRGEQWPVAAVRETLEETGYRVVLGIPLPTASYTLLTRSGSPADKQVRYWAAQTLGRPMQLVNEVDQVAWLTVEKANQRLDYAHDRDQLAALVRAEQTGDLNTVPVVLVRHAKARARSTWRGDDAKRPLDAVGRRRSAGLGSVLAAYGIRRILTSPSLRCVHTVAPYASMSDRRLRERPDLSEEGFATHPKRAAALLRTEIARRTPVLLCSHGPVFESLLGVLQDLAHSLPQSAPALAALAEASVANLDKGEALVAHVTVGERQRLVAVERYQP